MTASVLRRTSSDLASMSRAAQRQQRLLDIEKEQRLEDAEALKMTEEQRQILFRSFTSVKVEFSDLDGLKWTHSALRKRMSASPPSLLPAPSPDQHTFVILTNADLPSFGSEDTIRASRSRPRLSSSHKPAPSKSRRAHRSPVKPLFCLPDSPVTEFGAGVGDGDVEEGQGHAKRRRCSVSEASPPADPTPTQSSFITYPSSPSSTPSPSISIPSPLNLHLGSPTDPDRLPSPTTTTIPISKCQRVHPVPGTIPSIDVVSGSASVCCSPTSLPGLGLNERSVGVGMWTDARVPTTAATDILPPLRTALSLDCTCLPISTAVVGDHVRAIGIADGEDRDGDGDGDGDVVPPTPRPRDFIRKEL